MVLKKCNTCGIEKPLEDYHRNKNYNDGRIHHCKDCAKHKKQMLKEWKGKISQLEMHNEPWVVREAEHILTTLGYELYNNENPVHKQFEERMATKRKEK